MNNEFWFRRWAENKIGFHLQEVNPHLAVHWSSLDPKPEETVLVPLCGKTEDLVWLAERHHAVHGVELSDIAVKAFFAEHFYLPQVTQISSLVNLYEFDEIQLYCGDFFSMDLSPYSLIYDRAALIALPQDLRQPYVNKLLTLTQKGGRILLVTLDYDQTALEGPPFSVNENEIRCLFSSCQVRLLAEDKNAKRPPRAAELKTFREQVWLIENK